MVKKTKTQGKTQSKGGHRRPHHHPRPAKVWIACNIL